MVRAQFVTQLIATIKKSLIAIPMQNPIHVFELIEIAEPLALPPVVAVAGNDGFLRTVANQNLLRLGGVESDDCLVFWGDESQWVQVHDELATLSLFSSDTGRVAIIKDIDGKFTSKNRDSLEKWTQSPASNTLMILQVPTLPGNTTLYKLIKKHGMVVQASLPVLKRFGNPPDTKAILAWLIQWAELQHELKLTKQQAGTIVERCGEDAGTMDSECAKLALFADSSRKVSNAIIDENVGGWRTRTMWEVADGIAEGRIGESLTQIDQLLIAGQAPIGLLAQLSWSLRRFSIAAHLVEQGERSQKRISLSQALESAGFRGFELKNAETRLRRIGRDRAKQTLHWLVELESQLKGSHSQDRASRLALETFVMKFA